MNTATSTRNVTIVTTRGEKRIVSFDGTKWSELKSLLERGGTDIQGERFSGYSLNNMKCVESVNKHTLEHPDANVPQGNFALFLMPYKSKSGGEARDKVKAIFANPHLRPAARVHFGNYTQVKEEVLSDLLKTWSPQLAPIKEPQESKPSKSTSQKAVATPVNNDKKADVVASAKSSKSNYNTDTIGTYSSLTEVVSSAMALTPNDRLELIKVVANSLVDKVIVSHTASEPVDEDIDYEEEIDSLISGLPDVKRY